MSTYANAPWGQSVRSGLIGGGVAILLGLVGVVSAFSERYIVSGAFTMGQVMFLLPILLFAYTNVRRTAPQPALNVILSGALSGLLSSAALAALLLIGRFVNLRAMLVKDRKSVV